MTDQARIKRVRETYRLLTLDVCEFCKSVRDLNENAEVGQWCKITWDAVKPHGSCDEGQWE